MPSRWKKPTDTRRDFFLLDERFWMLLGEIRAQQRFIHHLIVSMPEYVLGPHRGTEPLDPVLERLVKLAERAAALNPSTNG